MCVLYLAGCLHKKSWFNGKNVCTSLSLRLLQDEVVIHLKDIMIKMVKKVETVFLTVSQLFHVWMRKRY